MLHKTHKRPEGPIDHFKSEISTLEDADKGSATHRAAMENYANLEMATIIKVVKALFWKSQKIIFEQLPQNC